jgi:hypothetical protein
MLPTVLVALALLGAGPEPAKSPASKKAAKAKRYTPAKRPASTAKRTSSRTTSRSTARRPPAHRAPAVQSKPSRDRYLEIEQALAQHGYLSSTPAGDWTPDSVEALKRFQQDQNLSPTGKIDSMSLIALGLGPRRSGTKTGQN